MYIKSNIVSNIALAGACGAGVGAGAVGGSFIIRTVGLYAGLGHQDLFVVLGFYLVIYLDFIPNILIILITLTTLRI